MLFESAKIINKNCNYCINLQKLFYNFHCIKILYLIFPVHNTPFGKFVMYLYFTIFSSGNKFTIISFFF